MATKQAFNYGGKEINYPPKQKLNGHSGKTVENRGKLCNDLGNDHGRKYENSHRNSLTSLNTSIHSEDYFIPNTRYSSVGAEYKLNSNTKHLDINSQQRQIQNPYQTKYTQTLQFIPQPPLPQEHRLSKQPQYSQQPRYSQQIEYSHKSKDTSHWYNPIYSAYNYLIGHTTHPELTHRESHQQCTTIKYLEYSAPIEYKPNIFRERVTEERNLFKLLEECRTSEDNKIGFISVEYDWREIHLKLEPGLNLLATCKNARCALQMEGIVCPRGSFINRNGYCTLDMELFKVICPKCKQSISPDESFGFGFYECGFRLSYRLVSQREYQTHVGGTPGVFYFGKLCPFREKFLFLEAQIPISSEML